MVKFKIVSKCSQWQHNSHCHQHLSLVEDDQMSWLLPTLQQKTNFTGHSCICVIVRSVMSLVALMGHGEAKYGKYLI